MKKLLILTLCFVMCVAPLTACGGDDVTTERPEETTTYDYEKIPDVIEPHEDRVVSSEELNFAPVLTDTSKYWVADAAIDEAGDVTVTSYNPGVAVITLTNNYSEKLELTVTVGLDYSIESIEFTPFELPENHVFVTDFGASSSLADNAPYIQAAIDSLPAEGGTVYVPRGIYKSTIIELTDNLILRLEGVLDEYNTEYTTELDRRISGGEFAVIRANGTDMFVNHAPGGWGRDGADNFAVIGGVLDMGAQNRCFIWCCADGVLLENVIMKDCLGNHAIQITGSRNVTIRNCMFAGYKTNTGANNETVQIETSHPGAINASSSKKQSYFDDYEYYTCANVTFENVYFGKSVNYGSHNIPIGHHGHTTSDTVRGLKIIGCTFDNPGQVALRAYAYSDVEIAHCQFISDEANATGGNNRAMIELKTATGSVSYKSGYLTVDADRGACRNYVIHDNVFTLGAESKMGGVIQTVDNGNISTDAVTYVSKLLYEDYKATGEIFTGYKLMTNRMENISIYDNEINIENTSRWAFNLNSVKGLYIRDNVINTENALFSTPLGGETIEGGLISSCTSFEDYSKKFVVSLNSSNRSVPVVLMAGDDVVSELYCTHTTGSTVVNVTFLATDGGFINRYATDDGKLFVEPIAEEGYVFDGYYLGNTRISVENFGVVSGRTIELRFVAE